jgi:hypothetical protein
MIVDLDGVTKSNLYNNIICDTLTRLKSFKIYFDRSSNTCQTTSKMWYLVFDSTVEVRSTKKTLRFRDD